MSSDAIVVTYMDHSITFHEYDLVNENFRDMKLSELKYVIELIVNCDREDDVPDKDVINAMDLIQEIDTSQHSLGKIIYRLTRRLRENVKQAVGHDFCVKSILTPFALQMCTVFNRTEMVSIVSTAVESWNSSYKLKNLSYIKVFLENVLSKLTDGTCHVKLKNKSAHLIAVMSAKIREAKQADVPEEYVTNAIEKRLRLLFTELCKRIEKTEHENTN